MAKELGNDAQTIRFVAMDCFVTLDESLLEELLPHAVEFAETLTNQAKELVISPLLGTALDDHGGHFVFKAGREIDA